MKIIKLQLPPCYLKCCRVTEKVFAKPTGLAMHNQLIEFLGLRTKVLLTLKVYRKTAIERGCF